MVQVLQAKAVTLRDLIDQFNLQLVQDQQFFPEWQQNLPDLTELERQFLDKVRDGYFNLVTDPPVLEKPVQLAIVAPLLFLADFYLPPFQVKAEQSIEISAEDGGVTIRGSLDAIVLKERVWLLVIESKRLAFSVEAGLAQLLSYLLATPVTNPDRLASQQPQASQPAYGLVTNGASFLFVKLVPGTVNQYATSDQFDLRNQGNSLYSVLKILKRIAQQEPVHQGVK
jgi:hypothetical protein